MTDETIPIFPNNTEPEPKEKKCLNENMSRTVQETNPKYKKLGQKTRFDRDFGHPNTFKNLFED